MNELPREARAMLALVRDAHDPPDAQARERVRTKVLAAVAIAPVGLSVGASQLGKPGLAVLKAWFGSKTALAGTLLLLAAGGTLTALHAPSRDAAAHLPALARQAPASAPASTSAAPATPALPSPPRAQATRAGHAPGAARHLAAPSLHAEVSLLARAAEQLERGDVQAARRTLAEHRHRFAHTQLQPERDGLEVLAQCQQRQPHAARAARAYLARNPASLLATRIEQACAH